MTRLSSILTATALLALTAGAAQAQSTAPARQLAFNGEAAAGCLMQTPQAPTSDNASVTSSGPGSADIGMSLKVLLPCITRSKSAKW